MIVNLPDNDPVIIDSHRSGSLIDKKGLTYFFAKLDYIPEDNPEWPENSPPFYRLHFHTSESNRSTMGIEVSDVQSITLNRIRGLEEI